MSVLTQDIGNILSDRNINWSDFDNSTVLVTGATGLIGSLVAKTLLAYGHGVKVVAYVRNAEKARAMLGDDVIIETGDICDEINPEIKSDYIVHCAAVTTSKYMVTNPVETLSIAVRGTENLLKYAMTQKLRCFLYVSSMEVYGTTVLEQNPVTENKLGFVDLCKPRSVYPEGKRVCELMCNAYLSEYGVPVRSARLAQTFGAGIPLTDNRVSMQFAKSALKGENIVLHTYGKSVSNFCYTTDSVAGILTILTRGENGNSYNVCNDAESRSIAEIAALVAHEIADDKIKAVIDIPENANFGFAPDTVMRLTSDKLRHLGWLPRVSMAQAYKNLCAYLTEAGAV